MITSAWSIPILFNSDFLKLEIFNFDFVRFHQKIFLWFPFHVVWFYNSGHHAQLQDIGFLLYFSVMLFSWISKQFQNIWTKRKIKTNYPKPPEIEREIQKSMKKGHNTAKSLANNSNVAAFGLFQRLIIVDFGCEQLQNLSNFLSFFDFDSDKIIQNRYSSILVRIYPALKIIPNFR